ncbi:energy transducer TonB [Pseudomonas delhiensis]|uniref:energy transducer TonB n=1 Tax=Pseudomonas delhiensis TaxID=366289 RepID=UPI003159DB7E
MNGKKTLALATLCALLAAGCSNAPAVHHGDVPYRITRYVLPDGQALDLYLEYPIYPRAALAQRVEGVVVFDIAFSGATGGPTAVEIVQSPDDQLAEAVRHAALRAHVSGVSAPLKDTPIKFRTEYRFKLARPRATLL